MQISSWLTLKRKVKFGECDSADVIHFHNLFRWAHESWEESLELYGIPYHEIFPNSKFRQKTLIPIINSEGKFFSPIRLGDTLDIKIMPIKLNNHLFQVETFFYLKNIKVAETKISHCAIGFDSHNKVNIPLKLERWIEASNIKDVIEEC